MLSMCSITVPHSHPSPYLKKLLYSGWGRTKEGKGEGGLFLTRILEYGSVEECLLSMEHVCIHSVFLACLTSTSFHPLCFQSLLISLLLVFSISPLHYSTEVIPNSRSYHTLINTLWYQPLSLVPEALWCSHNYW